MPQRPSPATMGRTGASLEEIQSSAGRNSGTSSETGGSSKTNASSDSQGGSEETEEPVEKMSWNLDLC